MPHLTIITFEEEKQGDGRLTDDKNVVGSRVREEGDEIQWVAVLDKDHGSVLCLDTWQTLGIEFQYKCHFSVVGCVLVVFDCGIKYVGDVG